MDHICDGTTPLSTKASRPLPDGPWVSLAEALTLIAFGDAMTAEELRAQVEGQGSPITETVEERIRKFFEGEDEDVSAVPGLGYFHDRPSGLNRLGEAWRKLREEVERGSFKVRGRFTPTYSLADAQMASAEEFTGNLLATFSQFDVSTGGIRRQPLGSPDVLWQNDPHSFDREFGAFGDDARAASGYLKVEVERKGLLTVFPAADAMNKSKAVTISTVRAENECREWLAEEFASDPDKKLTKDDFRSAALTRFSGRLSVRGFDRVWHAVAAGAGRSKPGRKS